MRVVLLVEAAYRGVRKMLLNLNADGERVAAAAATSTVQAYSSDSSS